MCVNQAAYVVFTCGGLRLMTYPVLYFVESDLAMVYCVPIMFVITC